MHLLRSSVPLLVLTVILRAGEYQPFDANADSICPQRVEVSQWDGVMTALRVTYGGDCASQGPYLYPCEGTLCQNGDIRFQILDSKRYEWRNDTHGFRALFKLQTH